MKKKIPSWLKKVASVLCGLAIAVLFALPYFLYREQIQEMAAIGYLGLLAACAISNSSILLPTSSTLIVAAAASALNPFLCILFGGLGTALGEQTSYLCGRVGGAGFGRDLTEKENRVRLWLKKHEFLTIFLFAFVPLPVFDFVGLAAGVAKVKWPKYIAAAVLGKVLKFALALLCLYLLLPALITFMPEPVGSIFQQFLDQF